MGVAAADAVPERFFAAGPPAVPDARRLRCGAVAAPPAEPSAVFARAAAAAQPQDHTLSEHLGRTEPSHLLQTCSCFIREHNDAEGPPQCWPDSERK